MEFQLLKVERRFDNGKSLLHSENIGKISIVDGKTSFITEDETAKRVLSQIFAKGTELPLAKTRWAGDCGYDYDDKVMPEDVNYTRAISDMLPKGYIVKA